MPTEGIENICNLYPELGPEELEDAQANLVAYVDVVCRIYERNRGVPPEPLAESIRAD